MGARAGDDEGRRRDDVGDVPRSVRTPWGMVVIPDDAAELADEVPDARRSLRLARRRRQLTRLFGIRNRPGSGGITAPLLIVAVAMTVALASMIGAFWPHQTGRDTSGSGVPVGGVGQQFPDLTLMDETGTPVRLARIRPAVVLSVTRCSCRRLIVDTAEVARQAGVSVVAVEGAAGHNLHRDMLSGNVQEPDGIRTLVDPTGALVRAVTPGRAPRAGTALVVLVAHDGAVAQVLTDVQAAEEFAAGVQALT